jgi:hypothetical protein
MFVMRVMKIATAGVIYGVASAMLLCLIGILLRRALCSLSPL